MTGYQTCLWEKEDNMIKLRAAEEAQERLGTPVMMVGTQIAQGGAALTMNEFQGVVAPSSESCSGLDLKSELKMLPEGTSGGTWRGALLQDAPL
jgi:hypothetical protein